jgi:hypothetical protein
MFKVALDLAEDDCIFSDNYFDAGESKMIEVEAVSAHHTDLDNGYKRFRGREQDDRGREIEPVRRTFTGAVQAAAYGLGPTLSEKLKAPKLCSCLRPYRKSLVDYILHLHLSISQS